jgi:hypothetical protein
MSVSFSISEGGAKPEEKTASCRDCTADKAASWAEAGVPFWRNDGVAYSKEEKEEEEEAEEEEEEEAAKEEEANEGTAATGR